MKKTIALLFLVLMAAAAMAQQQGMPDDQPEPVLISANEPIREQARARNFSHLQEMSMEQRQIYQQQAQQMDDKSRAVYQNQNQVRLAVHNLLAMEDLAPGIGPQVSQVAREFNNSVQATIRAEERIQTRSAVARFFAGGDQEAAEELATQASQNQQRVQQLQQVQTECQAEEEVCQFLQQQVQQLQQEQERLQNLSQREMNSKGLFGWIWK